MMKAYITQVFCLHPVFSHTVWFQEGVSHMGLGHLDGWPRDLPVPGRYLLENKMIMLECLFWGSRWQSFLPTMASTCPATKCSTVTITVHNGDIINCIVHIIDLLFVLHHYPFTNEFTALFSHT